LAALVLKEKVRLFRWSAVVVGLFGVVLMLWPYLSLAKLLAPGAADSTIGALCALGAAFTNAAAIIQTRRLTHSETTASIVFYFSLSPTIVTLFALPFVWRTPSTVQLAALIAIGALGGIAHILLTESYRYASASLLAPFDYVALLFAFLCGYVLFGELPAADIYVGGAIVVGSGLVVFFRERRLAKARVSNGLLERAPPAGQSLASDEVKRP
jgi:drug/metabolite transporter (DMT)-like permease